MGALVYTGLAAFGAAVSIAAIGASTTRDAADGSLGRANARRIAIIAMAYCQGMAVLGAVAGVLAVTIGWPASPSDRVLAAAPAIIGALTGLLILGRTAGSSDRGVAVQAAIFILGSATLAIVVTVLAIVLEPKQSHTLDGPFALFGLIAILASATIALSGSTAVREMATADPAAAREIQSRWVIRAAVAQLFGVGAAAVAIFLIVRG